MNEQILKVVDPIKNFWNKMSKKIKIILLSGLGAIVVIAVVLSLLLNRSSYTKLYTGLNSEQYIEVTKILSKNNIPYKSADGNSTVLVDKKVEPNALAQLATSDYPSVKPSYGFFINNTDFMSTDSDKRTLYLMQQNERMQDAIETISGIQQAIVTISMPEEDIFPWEQDTKKPKASVQVTLAPNITLLPSQVSGIQSIVSYSNLGLEPTDVIVTDTATGNVLRTENDMNYMDINNFKMEIENQVETTISNSIRSVFSPVLGSKNFTVGVKGTYDLDKKIKEIISHTPSTEDDKGIATDVEINKEQIKPQDEEGGVVGAENNADIPNYSGITADENNIYFKDYSNYKYAVNKTTEQITSEAGTLSDLTVTFTVNKSKRVLSEEDKVEFQRAVANAAGVPITKVQILNTEFYSDSTDIETSVIPMSDSAYVTWVSICSVLLLAVIIGLMIMNDKMKTKQAEMDKYEEQIIIPVADTVPNMEEEIKKAPESRENALRKEIKEFADNNPLIVAQLIRTWLRGDEEDE